MVHIRSQQGLHAKADQARQTKEHEAESVFLFFSSDDKQSVGLPVNWRLVDGEWYARPPDDQLKKGGKLAR